MSSLIILLILSRNLMKIGVMIFSSEGKIIFFWVVLVLIEMGVV